MPAPNFPRVTTCLGTWSASIHRDRQDANLFRFQIKNLGSTGTETIAFFFRKYMEGGYRCVTAEGNFSRWRKPANFQVSFRALWR